MEDCGRWKCHNSYKFRFNMNHNITAYVIRDSEEFKLIDGDLNEYTV